MTLPLLPASANAGLEDNLHSSCHVSSLAPFCFPSVDLLVSVPLPMPSAYVLAGQITIFGSTDASLKQGGRGKQCL